MFRSNWEQVMYNGTSYQNAPCMFFGLFIVPEKLKFMGRQSESSFSNKYRTIYQNAPTRLLRLYRIILTKNLIGDIWGRHLPKKYGTYKNALLWVETWRKNFIKLIRNIFVGPQDFFFGTPNICLNIQFGLKWTKITPGNPGGNCWTPKNKFIGIHLYSVPFCLNSFQVLKFKENVFFVPCFSYRHCQSLLTLTAAEFETLRNERKEQCQNNLRNTNV